MFFFYFCVKLINSQFIKKFRRCNLDIAKCAICEKTASHGNKLSITRSHISKRTTRTWKPNLRTVKTIVDGQPKKVKVCAKCLRSGKIQKA